VPGGTVTGNNLVWRQFLVSAITTSKIRVYVTQGRLSFSRITEIEAYGTDSNTGSPDPTDVPHDLFGG
jgi:hypothetical protein